MSSRRLRPSVAAIVALGLLAAAAPASAAVTQSNVTVPADPSFIHFDGASPSITVQGTSNGTTGDNVDLYCTNGTGAGFTAALLKATVPVSAGGGFTLDDAPGQATQRACVIHAVPAGAAPTAATNLSAFTGPRVFLGQEQIFRGNLGAYDFYFYNTQTQGSMDFDSLGGCGVDDSYVHDPASLAKSAALFYCNAWFNDSNGDSAQATRAGVQVDGRNAYPPGTASYAFTGGQNVPGFVPLTVSTTFSTTTGDMTIDETDALLTCPGDPYPATATNCPRWDRAPVDVHRVITMDHLGRMARITDAYTSRDGAPHTVDLLYEQDFNHNSPADPTYRFPWRDSTFAQHPQPETFAGPGGSSPGSIFVKGQKNAPDGDPTYAQGAISYSSPPERVTFGPYTGVGVTNSVWTLGYRRSVPASGALTLAFAYSDAFLAADVASLAREAEAALAPTSAGGGRPVAGGGSAGGGGRPGGSGGGGSSFRGVSVRSHRLSVSKGRLLLRLTCPSRAVRACRGTATLYAKTSARTSKRPKPAVVYGQARFSLAARRTASVRLKLSAAGRSAFRKAHRRLTGVLVVQTRDRARPAHVAASSSTVRLVAKAKPKKRKKA